MAAIYKIFRRWEYEAFVAAGETSGAPVDLEDGFIHFSTAGQVRETAAKHFGREDDLKLVAVDAGALGSELRWEPSRGGALFPHLYRRLRMSDVQSVTDLRLEAGVHDFSGLLS